MRLAPLAPLLILSAGLASADVLVVADDGTGEFTEIADAVAAAVDGDLIYVRSGDYFAPVTIDGLAIDVIADDGTSGELWAPFVLRNTSATQPVAIHNLEFQDGFTVEDCDGHVQLQWCTAVDTYGDPPPGTLPPSQFPTCGVGGTPHRIERCRQIALTHCDFRGGYGPTIGWDGAPGEHALVIEDSTALITDTYLQGGGGGAPVLPATFTEYAGAGGDALQVRGNSSVLHERTRTWGGLGYRANDPLVVDGCDGLATRVDPTATYTEKTSPELRLFTPSTVRGGELERLFVMGEPGATLVLVSSPTAGWRPFGPFMGTLVTGAPFQIEILGQLDQYGMFERYQTMPDPGTDDDFTRVQVQVLALHQGRRYLSQPWRITVIDSTL